jgi:hypothetical protein
LTPVHINNAATLLIKFGQYLAYLIFLTLAAKSSAMGDETLTMRAATKADLDGITEVVQAGFHGDNKHRSYGYPYRHDYPDDYWKWTRLEYEEYLDQPDKFVVLVVTAMISGDGSEVDDRVIAIGVWDVAVNTRQTGGGIFSTHLH